MTFDCFCYLDETKMCVASQILKRYGIISLHNNPKDPYTKDPLICDKPENPNICPKALYYIFDMFDRTNGTLPLHNFEKKFEH